MRKKREICEWETERYKYRKYLIFFDLSTMVPADFHAGLREKGGGIPETSGEGTLNTVPVTRIYRIF